MKKMRGWAAVALAFALGTLSPAQQPGQVATVAGTGVIGNGSDGRQGTATDVDMIYGVAVDALGRTYFGDTWNHRVKRIGNDGLVTTIAGTSNPVSGSNRATSTGLSFPRGVAVDAKGNVYIADTGNAVVRRVAPDGTIATFAGTGTAEFSGEGNAATSAGLRGPQGVAVHAGGVVYIADTMNFRIRKVDVTGRIVTIAGTGVPGEPTNETQAVKAQIGVVHSLAVDDGGNVYFADSYHHVVRKVTPAGEISTVAGTGTPGYSGDNGAATAATLRLPRGVAVDALQNLYISDSGNHRIRRVAPNGVITTVLGTGTAGYGTEPGATASAQCSMPYALTADFRGNVVFADLRNYRLRKARWEQITGAPDFTFADISNAASFLPAIAAGGLATIKGKSFGYKEFSAEVIPLPKMMGGVTVMVNNAAVAVLYVGPGQINFQVPWSTPLAGAKLKVNFGGLETEVPIGLVPAAPAIFMWQGNRGVIANQDYSLNTPSNAAPRTSIVVIYANSVGAVNPRVTDGDASPSNPLAKGTETVSVTFGGARGEVLFSGLAPGFVSVWQLNARVPADAPLGADIPVEISVPGALSNSAMIAIR
jgi:uncharacterized protein (TIGR03437 family)